MEVTVGRGQRIAQRFELDSLLSDVGLGECWSAQDLQRPDSPAQVEFLCPPMASGAATREAFDGLVARLRPVSNPGILGVIAGGEADGRLYVVTERLEGRSLANWLGGHRQVGTRPGLTVVQRVFDKACNALQFAHAVAPQSVVHRALTPRSILLRRVSPGQHHVKVGDFGLAPFSPGARTGSIGAWWEYQAPEQHGGRWNDPPTADVFALAVILVEMLSLSALPRAEGRETWWQFIKESRGQVLDRLVTLRDDVPRGVWEVIAAAMKLSAKERTPSVNRFQRALRDAWQAAGEWQPTAGNESEPPVPTSLGDASSLVRSAPGGGPRAAAVIDGWQAAERRQEPVPAARPSPANPPPARSMVADPLPARPSAPVFTPTVSPVPTMPAMAAVLPPNARPVSDSTEMIDLARHGVFVHATSDAQVRQDSTMALDLAALDPAAYGTLGPGYGRPGAASHPGAALFGESFEGESNLDPAVGTQVMSAGVGGGTEPPAPPDYDDGGRADPNNTTRAIDTAAAFARFDLQAQHRLPAEAMATLKAPVRNGRGFDPGAPKRDDSRNAELRATNQMIRARPATIAPNGFVAPAGVLTDATGDPFAGDPFARDPFARDSFAGDPFAGDAFAGDPFASSTPSSPPVEPTMAVPIEALLASAYPPYGAAPTHGTNAMPPLRPSMPGAQPLPPMHTPFAMGAPPRISESLPSRPAARTIAGQPAWIMIAIAALLVVSIGAAAFLLAGGR